MPTAKLTIIDEADVGSRTFMVNKVKKAQPLVFGSGEWDYLCGSCSVVIAAQVAQYPPLIAKDGKPMLVACDTCGSFNELPARPDH